MSDESIPPELEKDEQTPPAGKWPRVGAVLLGLSLVLWLPLPIIPFLSITTGAKASAAGGLVVVAEIIFWLGAVLAGPEAARRTRSWIRERFGKTN